MLITCKTCRLQYGPSVRECLRCRQPIAWDQDEKESFAELEIQKMISQGFTKNQIRAKLIHVLDFSELDAQSFVDDAFRTERTQNRFAGVVLFLGGFVFLALGLFWIPFVLAGLALLVIGAAMTLTGSRIRHD